MGNSGAIELLNIPFQLRFNELWQCGAQRGNVNEIFAWNVILKWGNCRRAAQRCTDEHKHTIAFTRALQVATSSRSLSIHWHRFKVSLIDSRSNARTHTPCHNLRCHNSRHTQPITAHFKGLFVQLHLAARLQITAYRVKQRTVSQLTPPSRMSFMDKPMDCKKTVMPQRVYRQTHKHKQNTHAQACTVWINTFGRAAQTGSCSVRGSSEVIKLQEGPLSGQISTGFQQESV